jgi:hypothetical protein
LFSFNVRFPFKFLNKLVLKFRKNTVLTFPNKFQEKFATEEVTEADMGADMGVDMEVVMVDEVSEVDSEVDSENKIPIYFFALSKEHENESLKFGH